MPEVRMRRSRALPYLLVLLFSACSVLAAQERGEFSLETTHISSNDLPLEFNEERTFFYSSNSANADSLLATLNDAGIRIVRAWQPLDNLCVDPIGPRFTVELATNDERVFAYGFARGVGRLRCSPALILFTVPD